MGTAAAAASGSSRRQHGCSGLTLAATTSCGTQEWLSRGVMSKISACTGSCASVSVEVCPTHLPPRIFNCVTTEEQSSDGLGSVFSHCKQSLLPLANLLAACAPCEVQLTLHSQCTAALTHMHPTSRQCQHVVSCREPLSCILVPHIYANSSTTPECNTA